MLDLLINPTIVTAALVILALLTPIAAWAWRSKIPRRRLALVVGGSGPAILALWGIHNLVLETVGFASIGSALILLALAVCAGVAAGWWLAGEAQRDTKG